jgi:peptide-methionine (R)-S-oxide reductase
MGCAELRFTGVKTMLSRRFLLTGTALALALIAGRRSWADDAPEHFAVMHSDDEWRKLLTPDQFAVLRKAGTERPFTSTLLHEERRGNFSCAGCDLDLFSSTTKFDSHTGWPSFWAPLEKAVGSERDASYGMSRTAVFCSQCGGHLGHVFDDGPPPTGLRYCMNGVAMGFKPVSA